uniref:L antigen family member 3 n=1 Tax=Piliocolobus tephrosceles TaxID=591936 RepID=A0A8C9HW86_9PRIM
RKVRCRDTGSHTPSGEGSGGILKVEDLSALSFLPIPPEEPGPGRDTASAARGPGMRPLICTLCVPFPTLLEVEIAHGFLALDAEPHQRVAGKDLPVSGRILAVPGIAEDCHLLRISIINVLDQLSLVVRTVWSFGRPPFPTKPGLGKWGEV